MRSNIGRISGRVAMNLAESGTDILLKWKEWSAAPTVDPTTESKLGTAVDKSCIVQGFVHYITATTTVRQNVEVEVGDCLVDLHQDVAIDGKDGLVFVIDGEEWKQKAIPDKIAKLFTVIAHNQKLFRTLVLTKTT